MRNLALHASVTSHSYRYVGKLAVGYGRNIVELTAGFALDYLHPGKRPYTVRGLLQTHLPYQNEYFSNRYNALLTHERGFFTNLIHQGHLLLPSPRSAKTIIFHISLLTIAYFALHYHFLTSYTRSNARSKEPVRSQTNNT